MWLCGYLISRVNANTANNKRAQNENTKKSSETAFLTVRLIHINRHYVQWQHKDIPTRM
jgi:hypothetical protein